MRDRRGGAQIIIPGMVAAKKKGPASEQEVGP